MTHPTRYLVTREREMEGYGEFSVRLVNLLLGEYTNQMY